MVKKRTKFVIYLPSIYWLTNTCVNGVSQLAFGESVCLSVCLSNLHRPHFLCCRPETWNVGPLGGGKWHFLDFWKKSFLIIFSIFLGLFLNPQNWKSVIFELTEPNSVCMASVTILGKRWWEIANFSSINLVPICYTRYFELQITSFWRGTSWLR